MTDELAGGPVLLYDGTCGLCSSMVRFILRHDRRGTLRFAALQGSTASRVTARHPQLAGVDSVVWYDPAEDLVLLHSNAALRVARYLGGAWRLLGVLGIVPRAVRDAVYDLVARHRHRIAGPAEACLVPPPDERARFLD